VEHHPRVLRRIAGFLVERLRRRGESTPAARTGVKTVAIVPAGDYAEVAEFSRSLARALGAHGATLHLDARRVDDALGWDGIARFGEHDSGSGRLVQWLRAILDTDPRSDYPLFAAARVYADVEDPAGTAVPLDLAAAATARAPDAAIMI